MSQPLRVVAALAVLFGLVAVLSMAVRQDAPADQGLTAILERGELVVLTRNAPTTWYQDRDGLAGPEYELTQAFAEHLGVDVEYRIKDSVSELLEALRQGEGDLVAAGITRTDARESEFLFGPGYQTIQQQVVCQRGEARPREPADLVGRSIAVIADSSYVETLAAWQVEVPELSWQTAADSETEQYLAAISADELDCTLADSNIVAINRRYFPELRIAFAASEAQQLAWAMRPGLDPLAESAMNWLEAFEASGGLARVMERYYGHVTVFDYVDLRAFRRRVQSRLPEYRELFEAAAASYDVPWTLLAAQAYQESHWNPRARSPTGVRGMMMLTLPTAKAMGVDSRLDPAQSIEGGARYLRRMLERLPDSVAEDDRLWFALAAYNVGFAHLRDARILAERLGRDPDLWHSLSEVLPLLSQKKYYKTLKYGYARGTEPVRYVQRIRNYQEILRHELES